MTSDGVILSGGHKIFRTALLLIAVAFSACTFYDNYDIDLMQGAIASVESSSEMSKSSSSVGSWHLRRQEQSRGDIRSRAEQELQLLRQGLRQHRCGEE